MIHTTNLAKREAGVRRWEASGFTRRPGPKGIGDVSGPLFSKFFVIFPQLAPLS